MILDLLFPNHCAGCEKIIHGEEVICEVCMDKIPFTHFYFEENNLLKQKCNSLFPTENAFALMYFQKDGLSQKIIHLLKYKGQEKIGKILSLWTSERLSFGENPPTLLTNIPLHPKKYKERGYNQLHLFTESLAKIYNIPYDHEVLKRNLYTKAQAKKDKAHRQENSNIFSIHKNISGEHILLIDDVITTGNTLASVAWELINNGNKVSILVFAMDI